MRVDDVIDQLTLIQKPPMFTPDLGVELERVMEVLRERDRIEKQRARVIKSLLRLIFTLLDFDEDPRRAVRRMTRSSQTESDGN